MDEWINGKKNVKWLIAGINGWIDELINKMVFGWTDTQTNNGL